MRDKSMSFGGVFITRRKAVLSLILLAAIHHVPSGIGGFTSTVAGIDNSIMLMSTVPLQTVTRPVGNKAKEGQSEQAAWWQTIRMRVTAYCPCQRCCGKHSDGMTAAGHRIERGDAFVAADRRHPFGTEMIVPGYNRSQPVKVLDRGGATRGNQVDVFFNFHHQAKKWGVKYLPIKVRTNQLSPGSS